MILGDTSGLALRNLREAKARTILTTLGVAIGIGALTAMVSLGVGLQEQVVGSFMRSGIFDTIMVTTVQPRLGPARENARGPRSGAAVAPRPERPRAVLDDEALRNFAKLPRVREVFPNVRIPVEVRYGEESEFAAVVGVPMSSRGEGVFRRIVHGLFFPEDPGNSCLLSLDMARRLAEHDPGSLVGKDLTLGYASAGVSPGIPLPGALGSLKLQRTEKSVRVVGVVEREPGPMPGLSFFSGVMLPLSKAQELGAIDISNPQAVLQRLSDRRTYSSVTVKVRRPQDTEEVEKKIKDLGYSAFSINDALQGARRAFLLLDLLLGLTGSVALSVALLGIANTMVMSILERTREIGIMKAIGGSDGDVRHIFLVEASLIGLVGGVAGIFLGWAAARVVNFGANLYVQSQGGTPENVFSFPWWLLAGAVAFSVLTSLLAGIIPAGRAARLDPIQALRHD